MDDNLFFKEATLLICSSLDVEIALWRSFQFISKAIPADAIYLNIYEPTEGCIRYVAMADHNGGKKIEKTIPLPDHLIHSIESGKRMQNYLVVNRPSDDPMGRIIAPELGLEDHSFIALRLFIEKQRLGVIDLFGQGFNRYRTNHAIKFSQLREPYAIAMANALKHQELLDLKEDLVSDNRYLSSELLFHSGDEVIGAEAGLAEVMEKVNQISHLKNTVLLLGETGTGKEVIANAIHSASPRCNESFIKVNCGAIPEDLIDSELFGHEKGAFTGADSRKRGRFERAHKGTIFLDEIGELPPWAQIRLLRVLQTQEIERLGGSPPVKLDIRVIAATHRDLPAMIDEGSFRKDLWFRINMFPITIPPLRERTEDIEPLALHFIEKKSMTLGINPPPTMAPRALKDLLQHNWPGNVRELENVIESSLIQHRHGPLRVNRQSTISAKMPSAILKSDLPPFTLEEVIRNHIKQALRFCNGKISGQDGAASILRMHPNTLRNKMIKLGIKFQRGEKGHD